MLAEGRGPRVPRSQGPKDQDISNSHSNTSLTLKKVHLVIFYYHKSLRLHGQNVATDCFKYCDSLQAVQPCEPFRFQLIVSIWLNMFKQSTYSCDATLIATVFPSWLLWTFQSMFSFWFCKSSCKYFKYPGSDRNSLAVSAAVSPYLSWRFQLKLA